MLPHADFPLIYLISDNTINDQNFATRSEIFLKLVAAAIESRVSLIQIREKHLSAAKTFELTSQTARMTGSTKTQLLVNDRFDIALAARADGVQLTAKSLSAKIIRRLSPPKFIIGASCHNLSEVITAEKNNADFAIFSPIFSTPSKAKYNLPPQGTEKLKEVCAAMPANFPVIALGGIDETNYQSVIRTGAGGIAAIRWLNDAENLSNIVKSIQHV